MSIEILKSITYENNQVFTRQCSNNVHPKHYDKQFHYGFTELYQKKGKAEFEKWFITNCLMDNSVIITKDSNSTLKKLNAIADLLYKDKKFLEISNKKQELYDQCFLSTDEKEKGNRYSKYLECKQQIEEYISAVYDKYELKKENRGR